MLAENGSEGLDLFRIVAERISLVILDMTMPGMSGEETLEQLKRINGRVPVILSTGFSEAEALRRFAGRGLAGFVQKPSAAAQVARKVKEVLEAEAEAPGPAVIE